MDAGRTRLLLVDDNDSFRELVENWLAPRFDLVAASSAAEAFAALDRFTPDLIVLDVMMPNVSGLDMYRTLRERPNLATKPVLFLTAYHQVLAGQDADFFKNCRVLLKPFRLEELTEQIEQMLADAGRR